MEVRNKIKVNTKILSIENLESSFSKIIFGTMRLSENLGSSADNLRLLECAFESGINSFHVSSEYSSYSNFCNLLNSLRNKRNNFKYIVKLPAPHFEDSNFNVNLIRKRVEKYLTDLKVESLDCLQWLLRSNPINDNTRIKFLQNYKDEFEEEFKSLKKEGKIKSILSFPYSNNFAKESLELSYIDGFINYLNLIELDSVEILELLNLKSTFIAVRPFLAGLFTNKLDDQFNLKEISIRNKIKDSLGVDSIGLEELALTFPLLHPKVSSLIISFSSLNHIFNAKRVLMNIEIDKSKFLKTYYLLKGIQ
tara:strand:- start:657 stop:1580 length:924 start_codon:yes stop_codon:yes gene_type:complete